MINVCLLLFLADGDHLKLVTLNVKEAYLMMTNSRIKTVSIGLKQEKHELCAGDILSWQTILCDWSKRSKGSFISLSKLWTLYVDLYYWPIKMVTNIV